MTRMVRKHSTKRLQATGVGGRFVRNTLENTFGVSAIICVGCGAINSYAAEPVERDGFVDPRSMVPQPPTHCHVCGVSIEVAAS